MELNFYKPLHGKTQHPRIDGCLMVLYIRQFVISYYLHFSIEENFDLLLQIVHCKLFLVSQSFCKPSVHIQNK